MIKKCTSIACFSAVTCNVNDVADATKSPNQAIISYPNSVTYTCIAGYQLFDGSSSVTISCWINGILSEATPTCVGKFDFTHILVDFATGIRN